ncbi:MAG: nucleotidyltransferase domain-containing protein [Nanoarchaeota archaeon]
MIQIEINYKYEILILILKKKESYGRELAKELKTSLTRVQSILDELRNASVIDYKVVGKNHIYFLKKNLIARSFIINAENYKFVRTIQKYHILGPIFEDIIKKSKSNLIILFGSYAKGLARDDSDIDIYIDTRDIKEKEVVESIYSEINVKIRLFDAKDLLISEIIKNHVIIKGVEKYYDKYNIFK